MLPTSLKGETGYFPDPRSPDWLQHYSADDMTFRPDARSPDWIHHYGAGEAYVKWCVHAFPVSGAEELKYFDSEQSARDYIASINNKNYYQWNLDARPATAEGGVDVWSQVDTGALTQSGGGNGGGGSDSGDGCPQGLVLNTATGFCEPVTNTQTDFFTANMPLLIGVGVAAVVGISVVAYMLAGKSATPAVVATAGTGGV